MVKKFHQLNENNKREKIIFNDDTVDIVFSYYDGGYIDIDMNYYEKYEESQNIYSTLNEKQIKELIDFLGKQLSRMKSKDFNL